MSDTYKGLLKDPEVRLAFEQEWLLQEFLGQLEKHMERERITRSELARRMGTSAPAVTQAMREGSNLTMQTMVHMASAAGLRICLALAPMSQMPLPQSTPWLPWTIVYCERETANDQSWSLPVSELAVEIVADADTKSDESWCSLDTEVFGEAA